MTFIGIGSPIPELPTLPGQTGAAVEVTLDYPSSSACKSVTSLSPAEATPAGGAFSSTAGLTINSSTGVVNPSTSTAGVYTISYTVSGVVSQFALTIIAVQSAAFSYSSSSFPTSGTTSPTITGNTGGTFTSNASPASNLSLNGSTGEINLATSTIGNYIVTYTNSGTCPGTPQTDAIELVAPYDSLNSFSFDGVNDYFFSALDGTSTGGFLAAADSDVELSISLWFKLNSSGNNKGIFQWGDALSDGTPFILLQQRAFGTTGYRVRFYADGAFSSNVDINVSQWYNFILTRKASDNTWRGYLDGSELVGSVFPKDDGGSIFNRASATGVYLGNGYNGYSNCNIDEVSIWNTTLSTNAVTEIYNSGVPNDLTSLSNASSSNLKVWYKM
jgi:hypothetical protein